MPLNLTDLIDTFKAVAIANAFERDQLALYRFICRKYSEKFHTPLHVVEKDLSPEHVLLHYFESQIDEMNVEEHLEDLLEMVYQIEDPNYDSEVERELQDFAEMAEEEEKRRIAEGRKIWEKKKKIQPPQEPAVDLPTEGSINLSYLESRTNEK